MSLGAAQYALRQRQGAGARYDAAGAPHDDLLLVRRGTAYCARNLNALSDDALAEPSPRQGLSQGALVVGLCLEARSLAHHLQWARTGLAPEEDAILGYAPADLELGSTLPPRAIRTLFDHSCVHLDVEWRDLSDADWTKYLPGDPGRRVAETPGQRARSIWIAGFQLAARPRLADVPERLREAVTLARGGQSITP
ncbi:MAG: maleylpyruvate isomerase N-terminal domain-containing protein [Devosia sp.]|uniref:maleylpyruvate isomerase N-terminal domain-containing protein n=1 Tax=Devosia sp. TaxID=1871048 RepID=UPI0024CB496E|nr:maleylpyruvate isomerase N-terminal domain-containing protein [Devosia sp.]UYN99386.1 MAG: maleylpyruvate isomerase N-terminal domain-containing protein [Devosia sp.]